MAEADPLVRNGLGSPLCSGAPGGSVLAGQGRRNCETSGFIAAAAPTGNFGLDVHIDTGLLGLSSSGLLAIVQDLFVAPLWMALVWAMHALIVVLEWCFTIDLLDGGTLRGGVGDSLRTMQSSITLPWLAVVLPLAAILCAYHGLIRRRVTESLTQALLVLAMTGACTWVTIDPAGTVGVLGEWANGASLGTLAVTAHGSPASPGNALADSLGAVFATTIEIPWCYLEFGDVSWCRDPARLDPGLRAAALRLAASEQREAGCAGQACARHGADADALERSARLLRAARTNGEVFLALPPNGPARNAINDPGSLLRAICRSEDATDCHGSAAAPAEFRANHGTWPRVGGLLLIAAGVLGLLLLLGFVALRLLGAAIFSLLYLLLAPAVALAPALGEPGRAAFRRWAAQLLGAVVSKLLFAFLLGVLLAIVTILGGLQAVGWWTRWLLMSAFWWGTFARRHQLLQLIGGDRTATDGWRMPRRPGDLRDLRERVRGARERSDRKQPEPGRHGGEASWPRSSHGRHGGFGPRGDRGAPEAPVLPAGRDPAAPADPAALPSPAAPPATARADARVRSREPSPGALSSRLRLIAAQRERAVSVGNVRRAALLASRAERVAAESADDPGGRESQRRGRGPGGGRGEAYARFLDAQARLPPLGGGRAGDEPRRRSYPAMAGIAGYGRREFLQLDPIRALVARQQIDRELARRREIVPGSDVPQLDRPRDAATDRGRRRPTGRPAVASRSESSVMRDAHEVAAGRKRQLGRDTP
ncbi:MAG TPA: hypothetical protein VL988_03525 [Solirubrobacteraceae bacterium]|nr:hypothetical protein [Solirubrobacteraceae bacterium]